MAGEMGKLDEDVELACVCVCVWGGLPPTLPWSVQVAMTTRYLYTSLTHTHTQSSHAHRNSVIQAHGHWQFCGFKSYIRTHTHPHRCLSSTLPAPGDAQRTRYSLHRRGHALFTGTARINVRRAHMRIHVH